jgi:uncharacterized protein (DUF111 family)
MQLHLDAIGGMAGDMFIAALLDVFPDHEESMLARIAACGLGTGIDCRFVPHNDGVLQGRRYVVQQSRDDAGLFGSGLVNSLHSHHQHREDEHSHHHEEIIPAQLPAAIAAHHHHVSWKEIRSQLE